MKKHILRAELSLLGCAAKVNVATLLELSSQDDQAFDNGVFLYVNTLRSIFILDKSSTQTVDGITVLATLSGVGRWLRLPIAHPSWLIQSTWFIDPVAGDDQNVGITALTALKTHAELTRRWSTDSSTVVGVDSAVIKPIKLITVTLLGNLPGTDPINLKVSLGPNTLLAYLGTPTTVRAGSITVVKAKDRATNTPWGVVDVVTPFSAADIVSGRRIMITSGPNAGQFAWPAKFTAGVLRMSSFSTPTMTPLPDCLIETGLTTGVVGNGDPYVVEDLPQVTVQSIEVDSPLGGTSTNTIIGFANLAFRDTGGTLGLQPSVRGAVTAVFKGCSWNGQLILSEMYVRYFYLNCQFSALAINRVGALFRGGLCNGAISYRGGITAFDDDFMSQGNVGFNIQSSGCLFGTVCAFDSTVAGFGIGTASAVPCTTACVNFSGGSGVHHMWGSGNAGGGVHVAGGSVLDYQSQVPTVTGALGDFLLAGAATSRAWDEALSTYTPLLANTWANLAAAIAPGPGFGGNAHNVERDAHIVLR